MIDTHTHLEQKDYDKDRSRVIESLKKDLDAVVTSCAHPNDFEKTIEMVKSYPGFVFCSVGIHPEFIEKLSPEAETELVKKIKKNVEHISAIGEIGLDYNWTKELEWREKQKEQFIRFIGLAKELGKPLVIHSRDAYEECLDILEQNSCTQVQLHMFGAHHLWKRVLDNNWMVSVNTIILRSKKHKSLVKSLPLENLMLETDAPWLAPEQLETGKKTRNTPLSVRLVAEKIAEIKSVLVEEVDKITTENARKFFGIK